MVHAYCCQRWRLLRKVCFSPTFERGKSFIITYRVGGGLAAVCTDQQFESRMRGQLKGEPASRPNVSPVLSPSKTLPISGSILCIFPPSFSNRFQSFQAEHAGEEVRCPRPVVRHRCSSVVFLSTGGEEEVLAVVRGEPMRLDGVRSPRCGTAIILQNPIDGAVGRATPV